MGSQAGSAILGGGWVRRRRERELHHIRARAPGRRLGVAIQVGVETALYYTYGRLDTAVASLATDSAPGLTAY